MTVVFANSKGGVGKSTLAVHLAVWLFERGLKVALLDCDAQQSASVWGREAEPKLPIEVATTPEMASEIASSLARLNDLVVIDAPGGMNDVSRTCMLLADLAVFPITPSILDLRSVEQATTILKFARSINQGRPAGKLVLNRIRNREIISRELLSAAPTLGLDVAQCVIRDLKVYRDAAQQGTVVHKMGPLATDAADEMTRLFTELLSTELGTKLGKGIVNNEQETDNDRKAHAG